MWIQCESCEAGVTIWKLQKEIYEKVNIRIDMGVTIRKLLSECYEAGVTIRKLRSGVQ